MPPSHVWSEGGPVVTENTTKPPPCSCLQREGRGVPSRHPHPHCTLFPPHEQLLVAVVGGAMVVLAGVVAIITVVVVPAPPPRCPHHCRCHHACSPSSSLLSCCCPSPLVSSPCHCLGPSPSCLPRWPYSTHNPPHKQLLVRLGGGWCAVMTWWRWHGVVSCELLDPRELQPRKQKKQVS
jgi:hypothetical protein